MFETFLTGTLLHNTQGDAKDNYEIRAKDLTADQVLAEVWTNNGYDNFTAMMADDQVGRLELNPFCGLEGAYDTSKGAKEQV